MTNLFDFRPDHNDELEGATRRDAALALLRARRATLIRELQAAALRVVLNRGQVCPLPVAGFQHVAKTFAVALAALAGVRIDSAIYVVNHIVRLPNTRHPRTGLFNAAFRVA